MSINKNNRTARPAPASVTSISPSIELTDEEKAAAAVLRDTTTFVKSRLGEVELTIARLGNEKQQLFNQFDANENAKRELARKIALSRGVDVDKESAGTWILDFDSFSFKKAKA